MSSIIVLNYVVHMWVCIQADEIMKMNSFVGESVGRRYVKKQLIAPIMKERLARHIHWDPQVSRMLRTSSANHIRFDQFIGDRANRILVSYKLKEFRCLLCATDWF